MKKKYNYHCGLFALSILLCSFSLMKGQTTFQKIYSATINQSGTDVAATSDGGYIIVSTTEDNILNDLDIRILKTNSSGDTVWTKNYGGSRPEYPNQLLPTSDGNYFIVGYTQSFGTGDQNIYLLKINPANGDTLFTKVYGGFGNEDGKEIAATADGNYVIVGASNSLNYANNDVQLIKINPAGDILWTKYYGGPNYESARSVKLCLDGGFIIAGKTAANSTAVASLYLVKTNPTGDTTWTKTYGGPDSYEGKSILANSDGTYTLCVDDSSGARDSDVKVMKIDAGGTIIWNKTYGGTDKDICKMIQPTTDGGYIVAGISRSFGWINPDFWILKFNSTLDTTWTRHYGGAGHEHCFAVKQTSDGGYIAIGHTKSYTPNTQVMFLKLNSEGKFGTVASVDEFASNTTFNVYPNPSEGIMNIDLKGTSEAELIIRNVTGQTVFSERINSSTINSSEVVDLKGKESGIYFLTVLSTKQTLTKKIILQ
jgi:hypothetical protein